MSQTVDSTPLGWCQIWEAALFHGNHQLYTLAHSSAASHEVLSIHEERGVVKAEIKSPALGRTTVIIALPPRSLERCLPRINQLARQQGAQFATWLRRPSREQFDALEQAGLILWPQGVQEVQVTVTPVTGQEPCPCALAALLETGRLLEMDPWLLLRLRGLTPDILRRRMGTSAPCPQSKPGTTRAEASSIDADPFWGNPRALRTYIPTHDPETAPGMPAMMLGAPPVDGTEGQQSLSRLVQALYTQGGKDSSGTGN